MITMEESLISIGTSPYFKDEAEDNFKIFSQIFRDCQDIRRCGSASLDLSHVAYASSPVCQNWFPTIRHPYNDGDW